MFFFQAEDGIRSRLVTGVQTCALPILSSGIELAGKILKERYPASDWNAYIAQASDGDNFTSDLPVLEDVLVKQILPIVKFYTYVEIAGLYEQQRSFWNTSTGRSGMWQLYEGLHSAWPNLVSKRVAEAGEIIPVFREFFSKINRTTALKQEEKA